MCSLRPSRRKQRGSVLAEAALTVPLLLTILLGIISLGWMVYAYNVMSHAAREATRYAVVHVQGQACTNSGALYTAVQGVVTSRATGLNATALAVSLSCTPNNQPGATLIVQVKYNFQPFVPLVPQGTFTLQSTSEMVISQ